MATPPKSPRKPRKPPTISWHLARYLVPIEPPARGSELRKDLGLVSGSNRPGPDKTTISQFLDASTERILERHKLLLDSGTLWEAWFLLSDREDETRIAAGDHLYEGRYTVSTKKTAPKGTGSF